MNWGSLTPDPSIHLFGKYFLILFCHPGIVFLSSMFWSTTQTSLLASEVHVGKTDRGEEGSEGVRHCAERGAGKRQDTKGGT